jgi:t-SNARE complex subunit (syntaxin)
MVDRLGELGKTAVPTGEGKGGYAQLPPKGDVEVGIVSENEFMAQFFADVELVKEKISIIRRNTRLIEQKHSQALTEISIDKGAKNSNDLDDLMMETTGLGQEVRGILKRLETSQKEYVESQGGVANSAEARIRSNLQSTLSRKFMDAMSEYNDCQQKYKGKYQEKVERQYKIVNPNATPEQLEAVRSGEGKSIFSDEILTGSAAQAKQALGELQDRHKDIIKLENSIRELHQLFMDMAVMVEQQGELLDQIEHQVAEGCEYVKKGTEELVKARTYQQSAYKKKLYIAGCCAIAITILIVWLVTQFS